MTHAVPSIPAAASTRPQYFLSYAVLGSTTPFLSVLLKDRGLTDHEVGSVLGVSCLGVVFTPLLVTFLADTAVAGRIIMGLLFALAGVFAALLLPFSAFWPVLIFYSLHSFCLQAIFPLQDGIHFAAQSLRKANNLPEASYTSVRVWGSVGYILPGAILWFILGPATPGSAANMTPTLYIAAGCAAVGAIYALVFLPRTPPPSRSAAHSRLPTGAAARAMLQPRVLIFCIAMFLIHLGSQAYYYGYPLHLVERSHLAREWVGPVTSIGVVIEIGFMLGFSVLLRRIGLRRIMYLGAFIAALRLFILAAIPDLWMAIASQSVHGLTVIVIHIAAPIFLNDHATDDYRNSMQGLYTMIFAGSGRILGAFGSGWLAHHGLATVFTIAGIVCLIATALFFFAFGDSKSEGDHAGEALPYAPLPAED